MRIGRVKTITGNQIIVEIDGKWFDLTRAANAAGRPIASLKNLFGHRFTVAEMVADILGPTSSDRFRAGEPQQFAIPFRPRKIICVGRNFAEHAEELGNEVPDNPILFEKSADCCIGDGEAIRYPASLGRVDFEGELAIVIGKQIKNSNPDRVREAIVGYSLLNDVTARDLQSELKSKGQPWFIAKNRDTFCPFGPTLRLAADLDWPPPISFELRIGNEMKQFANTKDMIHDIPTLVAFVSNVMTLHPGDVIAAGTPEGVGPLHDGDEVTMASSLIGEMTNKVHVDHGAL